MKKQWKQALGLMLAVSMVAPGTALAAGEQTHVIITGLKDGQMLDGYVEVGAETYTNSAGQTVEMTDATALGALLAYLREAGQLPYTIKSGSFGDYVTKVINRTEKDLNANTGWSVKVNGKSPQVGADKVQLDGDDTVVWSFSDWTQTLDPVVTFSKQQFALGDAVTVTVTAEKTTYDANWNAKVETVKVEGAVISEENGPILGTTDANGQATITIPKRGLLTLLIEKQDKDGLPLLVKQKQRFLVGVPEAAFRDVTLGAHKWGYDAVQLLAERGIVEGVGDGLFEPNRVVTRGELAKMVALIGDVQTLGGAESFADVQAGAGFDLFIRTTERRGLMVGDGNGTFRPDAPVTREELAVVAAKLDGLAVGSSDEVTVSDKQSAKDFSLPYVAAVLKDGLMVGDGENRFRFGAGATRLEVATVLAKLVPGAGHQH